MVEIKYPIRYGQTGGKSVWSSYELTDLLLMWELATRPSGKGAWFEFEPSFREEMQAATGIEIPEKIQGINSIRQFVEDNEVIQKYLFNKFQSLITI